MVIETNCFSSHIVRAVRSSTQLLPMASVLPPCDYRVDTPDMTRVFCRHTSVHSNGNLVSVGLCRICKARSKPCSEPRPVPDADQLLSPPPIIKQVWNLASSLAAFVADGMKTVDKAEYERRLSICDGCDQRRGTRCLKCGCRLSLKARGRAFECPMGRWESEIVPSISET